MLLANLDNGYLWQDEAETALLARNTLAFGYPTAFDGRSLIEEPLGYGPHQAWVYAPWLPFYLLAGVFLLVGESTWSARLPFALMGWFSIVLTWVLARRLTDERRIHRLSVALLVCSVPFLLHMRQCRYYAMTTLVLLGVCVAYLAFCARPSFRRSAGLGALLLCLFHTNFGAYLPAIAALGMHQAVGGERTTRVRVALVAAVVTGFTIPWALFFYRSGFVGAWSLERALDHLEYYVRIANKHLVPLAAMALLSLWTRSVRHFLGNLRFEKCLTLFPAMRAAARRLQRSVVVLLVLAQAAFLVIPNQRHMRYLIPTLPLLLIGEAWWLMWWQRRHPRIGWAVTLLVLFTTVLQSVHPRVPLLPYLNELTHRYTGPMEGVVDYLRRHAAPGQTAKIPYDDRTLMFYTGLAVERPSQFLTETSPDWVIIRRDWIPPSFFESAHFRRIEATYDRIELEAPDIQWQNREDPGSHHFRTVQDAPPVVLYRKRDDRFARSAS